MQQCLSRVGLKMQILVNIRVTNVIFVDRLWIKSPAKQITLSVDARNVKLGQNIRKQNIMMAVACPHRNAKYHLLIGYSYRKEAINDKFISYCLLLHQVLAAFPVLCWSSVNVNYSAFLAGEWYRLVELLAGQTNPPPIDMSFLYSSVSCWACCLLILAVAISCDKQKIIKNDGLQVDSRCPLRVVRAWRSGRFGDWQIDCHSWRRLSSDRIGSFIAAHLSLG